MIFYYYSDYSGDIWWSMMVNGGEWWYTLINGINGD